MPNLPKKSAPIPEPIPGSPNVPDPNLDPNNINEPVAGGCALKSTDIPPFPLEEDDGLVRYCFPINTGDDDEDIWAELGRINSNPDYEITTLGGRRFSNHAIDDSLARHGLEPYEGVDAIIDNASRSTIQRDGATVCIQRNNNGTYNLALVNEAENLIVTAMVNKTAREIRQLGKNNGFDPRL